MQTYELGKAGSAFLESLLEGGDHLARALQREHLSQGRLFTFLPDPVDPTKVSLIEGSREFNSDDNSDWRSIELMITEHLKASKSLFVMELKSTTREAAFRLYAGESFRHFVSGPSNHTFTDANGQPVQEEFVGVYGYVNCADEDMGNVRELMLDRRPFGAIGVLSSASELPSDGGECDPAILDKLAAETHYILGTAYDEFGWIVWARHSLPESFKVEDKIL